ncbi:acetyltransferase (GNAT) family protein [Desulfocapsa sulfexigens DSM 10523]|uniref:Acetyltransferase (GNAT) family protein n=1 Tax=Desulfocapsa sulfexigens (strain DSM 10523 / SB164P1) TaxID=1167006 RepID=M1P5D0_DESSD|nr:GNAT family N-acetyltransferase [Desulfocapsa sulfexigens]AGF78698.1 acetyltransferase (GNAT) family protein [Desulfocapsa sulfexigens DSM 10523]
MIRQAEIQEAEILTEISFNSKGYWNYPKEFYEIWSKELIISSDYIQNNDVLVFENAGKIIGYYSIVELKDDIEISGIIISKGFWLEHVFIESHSIGQGIGTKMFDHLRERCSSHGLCELGILADSNSEDSMRKLAVNINLNIHQLSRIVQPLIFN